MARARPGRYPYLLESSSAAGRIGRYDILLAFPGDRLVSHPDGQLTLNDQPIDDAGGFTGVLNRLFKASRTPRDKDKPLPFLGGWFLYLGYELARELEPVLKATLPAPTLPAAIMQRIPAAIVIDHQQQVWHALASGDDAADMLAAMLADCDDTQPAVEMAINRQCRVDEEVGATFRDRVERIRAYIRAGDVFQVNLSRQWQVACSPTLAPEDAYARLRKRNPAPFSCLARLDDGIAILSSSPERLVEVRQGEVRTRPIAGTRPRGRDRQEDRDLTTELLLHPKERAEHIMLVDLERNDLGRICRPGSVHVPEMMVVESYAHVHHIVSEVCGELLSDVLPGDIIRAVFPGGTITGCPKIRCMEIIAELEQGPRDAYTGSIGYLDTDGDMDLNILIRTMTWTEGACSLRAGAGIVADSRPVHELAETRSKAEGMLRVFEHD